MGVWESDDPFNAYTPSDFSGVAALPFIPKTSLSEPVYNKPFIKENGSLWLLIRE